VALRVRTLTAAERAQIERLARSRTAPARLVERAQMVWYASQGERVPALARRLSLNERTLRSWLKRFNERGLAGLEDQPRPGRRPTYAPEVVGELLATALTDPKALGQSFGCWTVRRLETYLNEERGIPIKRSRIDELLLAEGLRWRTQESWFGERAQVDGAAAQPDQAVPTRRVDPQFSEKRGRSSSFTRPRPQGV
jgi:transposase